MANPAPFDGRLPISGATGSIRGGGLVDHGRPPTVGVVEDGMTARPATHGGSRNAGRRMKANTSGLAGISFRARTSVGKTPRLNIYICAIWTDKAKVRRSNAYNLRNSGGAVQAMRSALTVRGAAGLPQVSLAIAVRALRRYLERIDYPMPEDLKCAQFDDIEAASP